MPAAFIGHGSPMNALETNRYTQAWRDFGASVPRPRAVLVVSAHWYINATAVTAMPRPKTIHDFYGFPPSCSLSTTRHPGCPELYDRGRRRREADLGRADVDSWGIDHGTWSVLVHAFPDADVPVVQLAINAMKPFDYHLELGAKLAPLRDSGVLILGSGNVVHNLGRHGLVAQGRRYDWAQRFDEDAKAASARGPAQHHRARRSPRLPHRRADARSLPADALPRRARRCQPDRRAGDGRRLRVRLAVDDVVHARRAGLPAHRLGATAPRTSRTSPPDETNI